MKTIIAIDPGVGGGFCVGKPNSGESPILFAMPESLADIARAFLDAKSSDTEVWIEEVPKFTGKNRNESTTAVLFKNVGRLEGIAHTLGMSLNRVLPRTWQQSLVIGVRGDTEHAAWKRKLKAKACELYPTLHVTLKTADALLIWHYSKGGGR